MLRDGADGGENEYVCAIKRCLKSNIRRIYLFCNKERETRGLKKLLGGVFSIEVLYWEMSRPEKFENTNVEEKSSSLYIFFSLSILKTNIFFPSVGRGGLWVADVFPLFSPSLLFFASLFSLFFNRCKSD